MLSRMYRTCLLTLGAWGCLSLMFSGLSFAQKCPKGKTRSVKICGNAKRDVIGCCKIPKRKPKPKPRVQAEPQACPGGQLRTKDTRGQCCYPSQYWSRSKRRCMGEPVCPDEYGLISSGNACVCTEGKEIGQYTDGHCCWPNQEWTPGQGCVGEIECKRGFQREGEGCVSLKELKRRRELSAAERAREAQERARIDQKERSQREARAH